MMMIHDDDIGDVIENSEYNSSFVITIVANCVLDNHGGWSYNDYLYNKKTRLIITTFYGTVSASPRYQDSYFDELLC